MKVLASTELSLSLAGVVPRITEDDADEAGAAVDDGDDDEQISKVMSLGSCGSN